MESFRITRVVAVTLVGVAVAMSNVSAQNANANANANGTTAEPPLPPKGPRAIFKEDGTPDGDKAAGNSIDSLGQLPDDPQDKNRGKGKGKHNLSRGPVDLSKSDYPSGPLPEINVKR